MNILKNDEHIDAAIKIGILHKAFVISHDGFFDSPSSNEHNNCMSDKNEFAMIAMGLKPKPLGLTYPDSDIYVIGTGDYIDDNNCFSNDFLKIMMKKITLMSGIDVMQTDFILDIDLDHFHSYDALNTLELDVIKKLFSIACAITIATEPMFAQEGIDVDTVLEKIIEIIKFANKDGVEIHDMR